MQTNEEIIARRIGSVESEFFTSDEFVSRVLKDKTIRIILSSLKSLREQDNYGNEYMETFILLCERCDEIKEFHKSILQDTIEKESLN